jgi:hypothetical protein
MRNIEFCDAVCDFCHPCARSLLEMCDYKAFIGFVRDNKKKWPRLASWFALQNMILLPKIKRPTMANLSKLTLNPSGVEEGETIDITSY